MTFQRDVLTMKKKKKKKLAASGHSSLSATRLAEDLQAVAFVVIRVVLSYNDVLNVCETHHRPPSSQFSKTSLDIPLQTNKYCENLVIPGKHSFTINHRTDSHF